MDEKYIEVATAYQEAAVLRALDKIRSAKELPATGHCFNCGENLEKFSGMRFCDEHCRDDWQKRKNLGER